MKKIFTTIFIFFYLFSALGYTSIQHYCQMMQETIQSGIEACCCGTEAPAGDNCHVEIQQVSDSCCTGEQSHDLAWINRLWIDSADEFVFYLEVDGDQDTPELEGYASFWYYMNRPLLPEFFLRHFSVLLFFILQMPDQIISAKVTESGAESSVVVVQSSRSASGPRSL